MQIEIDAKTIEILKEKAFEQLLGELVADMRASFNRKQLLEEIKNAAIKQVAEKIADDVRLKYGDEAIKRCVDSVSTRVNTQIHRRLQQGIIIKFSDEL